MDYYNILPCELQYYIQNIIKEDAIKDIKNYRFKNIIKKKNFLRKLMVDLKVRNHWTKYIIDYSINPSVNPIKIICMKDPYTEIILNIMDRDLITTGNEFFGDNAICSIELWISFLWSISSSIWIDNENTYRNYYTNAEILYYSLRSKTARGALMNGGLSKFSQAPPLIERYN